MEYIKIPICCYEDSDGVTIYDVQIMREEFEHQLEKMLRTERRKK